MSFKETLESDNLGVFLNAGEFAELHNVKYDGKTYEKTPLVLTKVKQSDRRILKDDHMDGVYLASARAYLSAKDLNGVVPEKGKRIEIDDGEALGKPFYRRYSVVTSEDAFGMITLELEAYDE